MFLIKKIMKILKIKEKKILLQLLLKNDSIVIIEKWLITIIIIIEDENENINIEIIINDNEKWLITIIKRLFA